tara:strand:- start:1569 stop:2570 length:1002 start_codon:yes stop_codon:yes gene_type:complete
LKGFEPNYQQKIGILITNLGTPDNPDPKSLRKYLKQFLSDKRVVDYNRLLWWLILNVIILNVRPRKSAKLYESIWTDKGSPLLVNMQSIVKKLQSRNEGVQIQLGMRYGNPSMEEALNHFKNQNIYKILVLPLYPQAGSPTNSSTFDEISRVLNGWPWLPNLRFINGYHDHEDYITAISNSIKKSTSNCDEIEKIIFSFHGMPVRYLNEGDPYYCFCHKTARLVAERLKLSADKHILSFQSRFGSEEWLQPYIDDEIVRLAKNGVKKLHIISPGFSVDCLETLEEIKIQYDELFKENGGDSLTYIPCLNDNDDHIEMIDKLIKVNMSDWRNEK